MKLNLVLLGVLTLLLAGTYIFQEKRVEKEHTEAELRDLLVKGDISHLKLPHIEAEKRNGKWWSGGQLLSHNTFRQIEKKLHELKKVKDIEGEWKNFFTTPVKLEINHEPWAIGEMSLDKQSFYLSHKEKIYLAVVEGENVQLTRNEEEIENIKYNELLALVLKPASEFKETQLFRFYENLPLKKVLVSVEGSPSFELNFEKNETLPPPIQGVHPHPNLKAKFNSLLTQMTLKEELPFSEKLLFKKLGEIKFFGDKENVEWELWLKGKNSADAFIIDRSRKKAWSMIGGTLKGFFVQVQDYWDKKVIPPAEFHSFTKLNMTLIQGTKKADVVVVNSEPLKFEAQGYKIDQLKMDQLMRFIFNLGPKDQAERVSQLTTSERKQLLSDDHLRLEVMNQELLLWRKKEELIVVNLTQGFKAHFNLLDENFHGTFEDVLK